MSDSTALGPASTSLARTGAAGVAGTAGTTGGPLAALDGALVEQVVIGGDLARLSPEQRVSYYRAVCESLGLNPLTQPFEYIKLQDRLRLYAKREATDQLRRVHGISVEIIAREQQSDLYVVTARASAPDGRSDESTGAVSVAGLSGNNLANAIMRAETKAKRRVTLSICGLGWLDESEVESVPVARPVRVADDGEIVDARLTTTREETASKEAPAAPSGRPAPARRPAPAATDGEARGTTGASGPTGRAAPDRSRLLRRWDELCEEADALGLTLEELPAGASDEAIIARGTSLRARVEQAKRARAGGSAAAPGHAA